MGTALEAEELPTPWDALELLPLSCQGFSRNTLIRSFLEFARLHHLADTTCKNVVRRLTIGDYTARMDV